MTLSVLCFNADPITHRGPNALLAAEVSLRRLDGNVSEQELDLLQFAARRVAQPSTTPHGHSRSPCARLCHDVDGEIEQVFLLGH